MIGVDFLAQGPLPRAIDHVIGGHAPQRLGEHHRSAAMKEAHRLARARLDRHRAAQEVRAELREFDAEGRSEQPGMTEAGFFNGWIGEPDCHARSLPGVRRTGCYLRYFSPTRR